MGKDGLQDAFHLSAQHTHSSQMYPIVINAASTPNSVLG